MTKGQFRSTLVFMLIVLLMTLFLIYQAEDTAQAGSTRAVFQPPTTNCDGTPLDDLKEYHVWWGLSPRPTPSMPTSKAPATGGCDYSGYTVFQYANMDATTGTGVDITVPDSEIETTIYVALSTVDRAGNESAYSNEVIKVVPPTMVTPNSGVMLP